MQSVRRVLPGFLISPSYYTVSYVRKSRAEVKEWSHAVSVMLEMCALFKGTLRTWTN